MFKFLEQKFTNVTAYQFFQLSRFATVLLISILLVRSGLSQEKVSSFELFIFLANLFSFFWVMGIKNATLSYYPKLDSVQQKQFFFNLFFILQVAGLIFGLLLLSSSFGNWTGIEGLQGARQNLLLLIYLFFYAPTVIIELYYLLNNRSSSLINYALFIHLLQFVLIAIVALTSKDLLSLFYMLVVWMGLKWIITLIIILRKGKISFNPKLQKAFVLFSIPLMLHILSGNGMEYVDGILVNRFFKPELFAVFRYGARELPFLIILTGAMSSAMIPAAIKNQINAAKNIRKRTRNLMHIFYPVSMLLFFISPFLYEWVYTADYLYSAKLFNIYLLIIASRIMLPEVFIYAAHRNSILMYVSIGELIINLLLSLWLIQSFGMAGIAFATVIAFILSKLFFVVYLRRKHDIKLNTYLDIKTYAIYTIALYLTFAISYYING